MPEGGAGEWAVDGGLSRFQSAIRRGEAGRRSLISPLRPEGALQAFATLGSDAAFGISRPSRTREITSALCESLVHQLPERGIAAIGCRVLAAVVANRDLGSLTHVASSSEHLSQDDGTLPKTVGPPLSESLHGPQELIFCVC